MHARSGLWTHIHLCTFQAITYTQCKKNRTHWLLSHWKPHHCWCTWMIISQMSIFISKWITGWKLCLEVKPHQTDMQDSDLITMIIRHTIFNSNLQRQKPYFISVLEASCINQITARQTFFPLHRGPRRRRVFGHLSFISSMISINAFNFYSFRRNEYICLFLCTDIPCFYPQQSPVPFVFHLFPQTYLWTITIMH